MRLTLRTLLAYLDDILDPAQTKEIGARISENSVASSLVARIREVTRRRRIASPELSGPGSSPDPNVVAEYLDNTLEPAAVADVERVCLDSDVHLAEVAACHQILTIVLGEPVTIRPELRERMYAMGSVSPAPPTSSPANPAPYAVGSAPPIASRPVVPDYLKRPPLWKKLVPLSALALVVAGWIYLVYGFLGDDNRNIAATPAAGKPSAEPVVKPAAEKPKEPPAIAPRPSEPILAATEATPVVEPDLPAPLPTEPAETPATERSATIEAPPAAPPVAAATPEIPPPPAAGIQAPVDETPAVPPPTVMYTSSEGILLHRPRGRQDWTMVPRRALLHVGDEIASPDPFVSDLQISSPTDPSLTLRVSLHGGARVRLLPSTPQMLAEIEVQRGRIAVYRGVDGLPHALGIGVTLGGLRTEFDAVAPQTRFGLLIDLPQPMGAMPPADQWPRPVGTLFATSGSVNVRRANLPPISGEATVQTMEWTNPAVEGFSPGPIPPWLDPDAKQLPSQKSWARQFESEFSLDVPVQNSVAPVAEADKRNTIATFATKTLALIDEVPPMIRVLTSPHEDARFAAMVGLREWVMLSPDYAPRLEEEINRVFRDQEAPVVNKLLWRLSDADARDEAASSQVIDWLASDNIAIRDLAYYEVLRIVQRDLGYRPQNTASQREPALMRFRELVRRNKGLLPAIPDQQPAAPPAEPAAPPPTAEPPAPNP